MEKSYKHIFKYTGVFGGIQGLNILVGLVRNKIIAILLGPEGVGLISIYNTASTLLQNATNFGLQMSGVRSISCAFDMGDEEATAKHIRILRIWSLLAAMLGFVVCLLVSGMLSQWAFSSYDNTLEFMLLAPAVAMAAIAGGETAILKATRRLKQLARTSVIGVLCALVVSVPLFYEFGNDGIIPSIIILALIQMILAIVYSWRYYPPRISFRGSELLEGKKMITLGTAFVVAGIFGSGAEFAIRSYLSDISVSLAGLYNAGYMITMTYAGMVFAAMETDYYPHLSAVCHDTVKMNGAVNRQIEVSLTIVAPMLVALMMFLPVIIPLLFSGKFIPVVGMAQIAVLAMYFRALNLPIAYIMLAKGDSKSYMFMELAYDILIVLTVVFGYDIWGLCGTGAALAITGFVDCVCVMGYCCWKYDLVVSRRIVNDFIIQLSIGILALVVCMAVKGLAGWICGIVLILSSIYVSVRMFRRRMHG